MAVVQTARERLNPSHPRPLPTRGGKPRLFLTPFVFSEDM
ncbi:hypothetical protein SAMN05216360_103266 [Methylobacterium phyllostachyos]|uniref:Uncharacterized protein n=1 Tax=Methylobacterium phyllostachyos TaxID=582672 RepID=A0A1G9VQI1_9HYPH|nr:hypothetical protein SAMN05216360_103266 [Methylobacterium phyllostachyos]